MENAEHPQEKDLWRFLADQHGRLYGILEDVRALAEQRSFRAAAKRFGEFRIAEERHIHAEEELLDLLEHAPGCPDICHKVREEHSAVLKLLEELSGCLSRDVESLGERLDRLAKLLRRHEEDERELMFPDVREHIRDPDVYHRLLRHVIRP